MRAQAALAEEKASLAVEKGISKRYSEDLVAYIDKVSRERERENQSTGKSTGQGGGAQGAAIQQLPAPDQDQADSSQR